MRSNYESVRSVWDFEKFCASQPKFWFHQAWNLKCAYEVLLEQDQYVVDNLFGENKDQDKSNVGVFGSAGVERMLIGFCLENLVKAILLLDIENLKKVFKKDGNLSWEKDGHNLIALYNRTDIEITKVESTFLELWQMCALWAGRYPISVNEHHLPKKRKSVATRDELINRSKKRIRKAFDENDPLLGVDISDLLHTGMGNIEKEAFKNIFNKSESILKPYI